MILHLAHTSSQGHLTAFVRKVDSDIEVLAIAFFEQFDGAVNSRLLGCFCETRAAVQQQ